MGGGRSGTQEKSSFKLAIRVSTSVYIMTMASSVRNSPRQSANTEAFAKAYLHFIAFAEAVKFLEILKQNIFPRSKKEIFCKKKDFQKTPFFTRHKLLMCIYIHYSYLHFVFHR